MTSPALDRAEVPAAGAGSLSFRLAPGARSSVAETCAARSPLKLLAPDNHGEFAWVFAASFGGGLVDGDHVALRARVHPGAGGLLGTQAGTKVYRSVRGCRQDLEASVDDDGALVVLPDPVSPFAGARYTQRNEIHLGARASLLLVDAVTCGRRAHGERWDFARYSSRTRVFRQGQLILHDALLLDPAHRTPGTPAGSALRDRMGRFEAVATLSLLGPRFAPIAAHVLAMRTPLVRQPDVLTAASPLESTGAVLRLAATSVEGLTRALRAALAGLPVILGDDPLARKW